MTLLGMEMNATRARAVIGPAAEYPLPLPLDPPVLELPLVLSLEKKAPQVGQSGSRLVRQLPHLACQNFLPSVGQPERFSRLTSLTRRARGHSSTTLPGHCPSANP